MKTSMFAAGVAVLALAAVSVGLAQGKKESSSGKGVIYASADEVTFKEASFPGVSMATVWGDPQKDAHGQFTKFAPGYDAGMHTHTNTLTLVVIKGAYLYRDEAGEKRVGAGGFMRIPGGHKHWSGGDPADGALFYEESTGKFDKIDAK
jgi:quercetin dioxygenase-like cupin family protein